MSARYESRQELANKIDHEGGLESFLQYGYDPYEDGPEGDDELQDTAITMQYKWREYQEWAGFFQALLPEPGEGE